MDIVSVCVSQTWTARLQPPPTVSSLQDFPFWWNPPIVGGHENILRIFMFFFQRKRKWTDKYANRCRWPNRNSKCVYFLIRKNVVLYIGVEWTYRKSNTDHRMAVTMAAAARIHTYVAYEKTNKLIQKVPNETQKVHNVRGMLHASPIMHEWEW